MTPTQRLEKIKQIIEDVDNRAMAIDGSCSTTLQVMTQKEISMIYKLSVNKKQKKKGI